MICLAEARFVEILDQGGLDAARPEERTHLEGCGSCRESWAAVAAAGEVLADARPKAAPRARLFPVLVAAAVLLTIIGVIVVRNVPSPVAKPRDPLVMFLEGNPEEVRSARAAFLKQGRKAVPMLLAARPGLKGSARLQALQGLLFDLKRGGATQDPDKEAIYHKLDTMKVDLRFDGAPLAEALGMVRDFAGLNIVLDPSIDAGWIDVMDVKASLLREALDLICTVKGLDYDVRYGVLFVSSPLRLWSTEAGVGLPEKNGWTTQALEGPLRDKLLRIRLTLDMQGAPASAVAEYVADACGLKVEVAAAAAGIPVTLAAKDLLLSHVLELLTLPRGWDVRVEQGVVRIEGGR